MLSNFHNSFQSLQSHSPFIIFRGVLKTGPEDWNDFTTDLQNEIDSSFDDAILPK